MRGITYREAITEAMAEEMRLDSKVVLMGEDVGDFGGLTGTTIGLIDEFGNDRVMNMPISESGFVGAAIGAALQGIRPIVELGLADVILVAMDQIVNTAAKMNYFYDGRSSVPAVFRIWSGFRPSGGPQQSQSNEAMFAHVPGLKVVMPSTPYDVKGLLKSAIRDMSERGNRYGITIASGDCRIIMLAIFVPWWVGKNGDGIGFKSNGLRSKSQKSYPRTWPTSSRDRRELISGNK